MDKTIKTVLIRSPLAVSLVQRRSQQEGISAAAAAAVTIIQALGENQPNLPNSSSFRNAIKEKMNDKLLNDK